MPNLPAVLPKDLLDAYRNTDYTVFTEPPVVLAVGAASPAMAALLQARGAASAVLVTACNPFSQSLASGENAARTAQLQEFLETQGWSYVAGSGKSRTGAWAAEPGFLVFGVSLEQARELAAEFEQNAVVWCAEDGVPQLLLHPDITLAP